MLKGYEKFLIIFSIILILFISIGSISAFENTSKDFSLESSKICDTSLSVEDNHGNLSATNVDETNLEKSSDEVNLSNSKRNNEITPNTKNSSGKIVKTPTKVYAPSKTIKYKENTNYKIKVLDNHRNPVKNIILKVKVITGEKSKTYSIKTAKNGVAKLKTKKLTLGLHKLIIKTDDKKYKISKTTKITINKTIPKTEKLIVSAPNRYAKYNTNNYYQIAVKNSYADPVKNLVLKVKVFSGKKYETYSIKTNTNGVAKLQTKNLDLGVHKLNITTPNKKYNVFKTSKIIVRSNSAVKLTKLIYYPHDNSYKIKLTWQAKSGASYQILKKSNGKYKVISKVKANASNASYQEKVGKNQVATYSVRQVDGGYIIRPHDNEGLTLIKSPKVNVDFQNLKAVISWSKVSNATKYQVLRKIGSNGSYKCIATLDSKQSNYTDWYYNSPKELSELLSSNIFIDPSSNNLFYTVRACTVKEVENVEKVSYGLYLKDGDFHLEAPTIISLKDKKITWGQVPNAEGYIILKKTKGSDKWQKIHTTSQKTTESISASIGKIDKKAYYSVRAYATKNGVKVYSNYDKGFTLKNYKNKTKYRVLYIGDSITQGAPYRSQSGINIFSMPYRIAQLTGCVYYNPSISGSTYHDLGVNPDGTNVENTNYYRYRLTRELVDAMDAGEVPGNCKNLDSAKNSEGVTNTRISDYNVVVLSAGTNDYMDNTPLGSLNDNSNKTSTFNGALNHILKKIKKASDERVSKGLSPIKIVFVDLFYSNRASSYTEINNRDVTKNKIGLTLSDYQNALNKQLTKWAKKGLKVFNFKTRNYNIVTNANSPYTTPDNLHLSKFTYSQYGNAIAQFFIHKVFK